MYMSDLILRIGVRMKPPLNTSLSRSLLINSAVVLLILFISLSGSFLLLERADYRRNIEQLESEFFQQTRERVKLEVNDVLEYVRFRDNGLQERTKIGVKNRVTNACAIIEHIYADMSPSSGKEEILDEVVSTVRLLNLNRTTLVEKIKRHRLSPQAKMVS